MSEKKRIKIACVGGGSRNWVPNLFEDLALRSDVSGRIDLYDIDYQAARENVTRGEGVFGHEQARTRFEVTAHAEIGPALEGADFVVIAIQPGPIEMMARDIDIPRKYGILHTVGDTAGPAGTVRALRTIPVYENYAHAVMEHCPHAWVLNCTNPMALCVWTLYEVEPRIKAFGYCHEVFHTQRHLAELVEENFDAQDVPRQEIWVDVAGVNHFTLARAARWRGRDLFPVLHERMEREGFFADRTEAAEERVESGDWFSYDLLVAYDFLRRFGVLGAAGDRHLVEFVPWYARDVETLHRWGVVRTPSSFRKEKAAHRRENRDLEPPETLEGTDGEVVEQLMALAGLGDLETTTNIPNRGQVRDLPHGAVIESNVRFREDRLEPRLIGSFPGVVNGLQRRIIDVQRATLKAGLQRDPDLAFQAILHDPLCMISTDTAREMFEEMLEATKELLPGWDV
ncbi:MAG: alpha-glucosidase/alpha-galactosidase [Planctomycetota bacterium]